MISTLGNLLIALALAMALLGSATSFAAGSFHRPDLLLFGRRAAFAVLALVAAATILMVAALVTHDFAVKYVAEVGSRETPLYYTIISLWGALEGSILFWTFLLSLYTTVFLLLYRNRFLDLQPYITGILLALSSFFLFVITGPGNPFETVSPVPADGPGPNPLLQNHWLMGVHPVLLYLGYVGLSLPYAIAMASLLAGVPGPNVLRLIRRWALLPWVFLSLGILAGALWAYAVLGWGGYWSWDPVENASVMPWLVTTAFLHSLQVQERRQMLKAWTLSLIIAAFLLSILGTFFTRSGVLSSVHSFTQSSIGPLFLAFFGVLLVLSLGLLFARSRELGAVGALEATVCRESVFLFNNLLLVALTFTILLGTAFPLIAEALQGTQLSVGAPYFNAVGVPIGIALLFLMGVGPVLPWGAARLEDLQWRLLRPVVAGSALVLALLLVGVRGVEALITFGLAGFVLTITLGRILADVQRRRGNTREGRATAAVRLLRANPRRYGGYLVHLGVLLIVIGIAASQSYQVRGSATLHAGQAMAVGGYRLVYRGLRPRVEPNRMVLAAEVAVRRDGGDLGSLLPALNIYPTLQQPVPTPGIDEEPWHMVHALLQGQNPLPALAPLRQGQNPFDDLYVVLDAVNGVKANHFNARSGSVTLQVLVNPMVGFIWLGGLVMALGGLFALLPVRRRVTAPAVAAVPLETEEVPA